MSEGWWCWVLNLRSLTHIVHTLITSFSATRPAVGKSCIENIFKNNKNVFSVISKKSGGQRDSSWEMVYKKPNFFPLKSHAGRGSWKPFWARGETSLMGRDSTILTTCQITLQGRMKPREWWVGPCLDHDCLILALHSNLDLMSLSPRWTLMYVWKSVTEQRQWNPTVLGQLILKNFVRPK